MTTFSFHSFRILKISPYINFKKILDWILAPPSGRRPGADAPPPAPPSLRHWGKALTADPVVMRSSPATGHILCALLVNQPK